MEGFGDDEFMDLPFFVQDGDESDPMTPRKSLSGDDVQRMSCHIRPFPLPAHYTPVEHDGFVNVDDETLMKAPPQLIVHLQRTASQGGFQVISPRQTPLSMLMARVDKGERQLGDHVVGSVADEFSEWPTLRNFDVQRVLPDEPLPGKGQDEGLREKTRTLPLTSAGHLLVDPIMACLVKGRAVIDILRRDDVQGGADEMLKLLADAWGIRDQDLMDLDAYSLGIDGPLLRHAIKADEVYPTIYAPIHQKRCISVSSNEVTREYLPLDSAWDWRRMRVMAEAVFAMCMSIEGYSYVKMRATPPPGDPNAPISRGNVLAFRPLPCTAWWAGASSFSIMPIPRQTRKKIRAIPKEVLSALARYTEVVKPMSRVLELGSKVSTRQTLMEDVEMATGETLRSAYSTMTRHITTNPARGKQPAATVRNYVYEAIENADLQTRLRLSRYISIAKSEIQTHLMVDYIPDEVVDAISVRFLSVGNTIRQKVQSECGRRGYTQEEAWHDFSSQLPIRYKSMTEGTMAWAKGAMYLIFSEPTRKWHNLAHAVSMESMRNATRSNIGGVALPAKLGSGERLLAAARWAAKEITSNFYGYYVGSSDVALAIADTADRMSKPEVATLLRESAYLWSMRARAFRGTNVNAKAHGEEKKSQNHYLITAEPIDLVLAPNPYRAYTAYVTHALDSPHVSREVKSFFRENHEEKPVSELLQELRWPVYKGRDSKLTRYCLRPWQLGQDMEKAWRELVGDLREVASRIMNEAVHVAPTPDEVVEHVDYGKAVRQVEQSVTSSSTARSYYQVLSELEVEEVDSLEDRLDELPRDMSEMIMGGRYADKRALFVAVAYAERDAEAAGAEVGETVL